MAATAQPRKIPCSGAEVLVRRSSQQGSRIPCFASRATRRCCWRSLPRARRRPTQGETSNALFFIEVGCSPDGSQDIIKVVSNGNSPCNSSNLIFGALRRWRRGTRLFSLQGLEFYAFTSPHEDTAQIAIWRRLGDAVDAGYSSLDPSVPCRVGIVNPGESFAPGKHASRVGAFADLYMRKVFDRNELIYWESFWAPISKDPISRGSSGEATFRPLITRDALTKAHERSSGSNFPNPLEAARTEDTGVSCSKAEAFSEIYRKGIWPGLFSRSGPGSDPFHPMVRVAITALDMAIDVLGVRSMLDAACGDAEWIAQSFLKRRPEVVYTGIDIVSSVIEENQRRHPALRFYTLDLSDPSSSSTLPKGIDLVFSKETLNHMFVEDAVSALQQLQSTGARYLVTNITRGSPNNLGAKKRHHANYAQYDYSLPPFNLRKLARLVDLNREDWTEFALFDFKP
eukprot:TRINITY_DN26326_c0_g1_i1.p1 TRINITY_DN26326_c0_g1~~TRINITY_DN26326_c0_g1_i1.p1  ORF type:complete len:476 (-),score=89.21 TRINITY_DN26326_c0_g1_i1:81-1448(-)